MKLMETCPFCGKEFVFGPHQYDGKLLSGYGLLVCETCYSGNWDGWSPFYEKKILEYLEQIGIEPPERNEKGYLPCEF